MKNEKVISTQQQTYTTKGIALGVFLAIVGSCTLLSCRILVKENKLKSSEVCFIRGLVQISYFSISFLISSIIRKKSKSKQIEQEEKQIDAIDASKQSNLDFKLMIVVFLCGLSFGTSTLLAFIGVKLLPLSDFVVFFQTNPVFTLILSAVILR